MAYMMSLDKAGERQLHVGFLLGASCSITTVVPEKGKFYSPLESDVALRKPRLLGLNPPIEGAWKAYDFGGWG
jgi:hypothetical protein